MCIMPATTGNTTTTTTTRTSSSRMILRSTRIVVVMVVVLLLKLMMMTTTTTTTIIHAFVVPTTSTTSTTFRYISHDNYNNRMMMMMIQRHQQQTTTRMKVVPVVVSQQQTFNRRIMIVESTSAVDDIVDIVDVIAIPPQQPQQVHHSSSSTSTTTSSPLQLQQQPEQSLQSSSTTTTESSSLQSSKQSSSSQPQRRVLTEPALWEYNFGLQDPKLPLPLPPLQKNSEDTTSTTTTASTRTPEKFQITPEQLHTLHTDGVVHISNVFNMGWVQYLRDATTHQTQHPHFWAFAGTASKLYDYIQRNVWQTNKAFTNFYYYSAIGHVLAQCGNTNEIRISTDLLMVNPNKGFKWHQDNQNGPITPDDGIRFWITMDETPATYGAPVYLKKSHTNTIVDANAVFVDIYENNMIHEYEQIIFQPKPGDMIIWHPKTIHKIDGPADGIWTSYRRVLGGTVAKGNTLYHDKRGTGGVLSDLGKHNLVHGDKLSSSYFPIIYPHYDTYEAQLRDDGQVGRSMTDIVTKVSGMISTTSTQKFRSFFDVLGSRK